MMMMAMNQKLCFTLFLLSVLVLCAGLALGTKDPELKHCEHQCRAQRQYDKKHEEQCIKKCEQSYKEKKQRERGRHGESEEEGEEWGRRDDEWMNPVEPAAEKHLQQCQRQCDRQEGGQQKALCRLRCQEKYRREKEEEGRHNIRESEQEEELQGEEEGGGGGEEEENPYVFEKHHFTTEASTEHGRAVSLPKFTQRSKLLRGLENYRLGIVVANPQTFVAPVHVDADVIAFVSWGRGTFTMIRENNRESYNVERGDIIMVPAGTTFYVTNRDDNEKLYIVKLKKPVNLPGHFERFHGAGGVNPESFFRAFSSDILEAAFKTSRDRVERVFSQQDKGLFMKASKEQIRALSRSHEGPGIWPFAGESRSTFNLFKKRPSYSNNYGELFEADSDDLRPLEDVDIRVSYANITRGAMSAVAYNSRSTKIAVVVAGEGYIEIACPHIAAGSSSDERQRGGSRMSRGGEKGRGGATKYSKVSSGIRTDSAYIVPAGHPFVTVASENKNLEVVCFEINAEGNIRYPLAGRRNIYKLMEREAKELAFNTKADEVERVFGSQDQDGFFPGPTRHQQQQEGRADE